MHTVNMTTNQHGGPRPATREDDGRRNNPGGAREGAGPKPKSFTLKLDDGYYVTRNAPDGKGVLPAEAWIVETITRTYIILRDHATGDRIRLVR